MMKRRKLMRYAGAIALAAVGTAWSSKFQVSQAQTSGDGVTIEWYGHTCFLFTTGNKRILVNPFRPLGCTAGYRPPNINTDLVLISSQLLDEGSIENLPGSPRLLYEPGVYEVEGIQVQGIRTDHDREGGRRFGTNVAWLWTQGGIKILHLGGIAAPISIEQKILMGRPDVVLVPVGGGPKAYNPTEAKQAVTALNPRLVIPTHYRTQAADANTCDIVQLDEFLNVMDGTAVRRTNGDTISLTPQSLPDNNPVIQVLSYNF